MIHSEESTKERPNDNLNHVTGDGDCNNVSAVASVDVLSDASLNSVDDKSKYVESLYGNLGKFPLASDLKWSLFCSACESYRYNTLVKPFPKAYIDKTSDKMIRQLVLMVTSMPSFSSVLEALRTEKDLTMPQIELLCWVLLEATPWQLIPIKKTEVSSVISKAGPQRPGVPMPTYLFEFKNKLTGAGARFQKEAKMYGTKFAFHGSRVENFYSILNHGLQISMNKNGIFGSGIYLSSDLGVSLQFSPYGFGWSNSEFGSPLGIIALCEIIDHPDVKCQDDKKKGRSLAGDTSCGEVPKKYYLVQNSDLVCVRYLLIYANKIQPKKPAVDQSVNTASGVLLWLKKHLFATLMVGYAVILIAIAIAYTHRPN